VIPQRGDQAGRQVRRVDARDVFRYLVIFFTHRAKPFTQHSAYLKFFSGINGFIDITDQL
jgi:hypothetical protein